MVKPLAEEINSINSTLSRKGVSEQIGSKCLVYLPELDITSLLLLLLFSVAAISTVIVVLGCCCCCCGCCGGGSCIHQFPEAHSQVQIPAPPYPIPGHPIPGGLPQTGVPGGED